MTDKTPKQPPIASVAQGLAQGSAIGIQAGCLGTALVIGALLLGLWLDGQLHTRPWFTLVLLLVSAPVSVYAIYRFALRAAHRAQARERQHPEDEPPHDTLP